MSQSAEPPPAQPAEGALGWLNAVKGLTVTNVLVILLLVVIAVPAYLIYRALNDAALLDRLMSQYTEIETGNECLLRKVKTRGGPDTWGLSQGFAYFGKERWTLSVILGTETEPTKEEIASHCEVLGLTIDWMREPGEHAMPTLPGTDTPLIWSYPEEGGHRGHP